MIHADIIIRGRSFLDSLKKGDCAKTALIIPGGGFQGARSIGMTCGLQALGLTKAFSAVYGVSAGAANAAYFLAGQAPLAASVYCEDLTDKRYLSLRRWPVINMDYLVWEVFAKHKKLNINAILQSPTKFFIPLSNEHAGSHFIEVGREIPVLESLRLAMSFFFYTDAPVIYKGNNYLDGNVIEPLPWRKAVADGYKNILVLLNMPLTWDDADDNLFLRLIKLPWLKKMSPIFRQAYFLRQKRYREQLTGLLNDSLPVDVNITVVAPHSSCVLIPPYTRNNSIIKQGVEDGILGIKEVFGV